MIFKTLMRILAVPAIVIAAGAAGMIIGALIGGNFATQFEFNGVRGYEATGQIGAIAGAALGLVFCWWIFFKEKPTS